MSSAMRDLWPEDIRSEEVLSPEEILEHQASRLEARTNGLLAGHLVKHVAEDRVVIGFEVEAPRAGSRVRLFEVQHRLDFEYPVSIVPPDDELPEFLRERVYQAGPGDLLRPLVGTSVAKALAAPGEWVENTWLAASPNEFVEKVETLLRRPAVKAIVLSLLSRVTTEKHSATGDEKDSP